MACAGSRSLHRTSFHARWKLSFQLTLGAHIALLNVGHQLRPLVARHAEGACHQAVAATDALRAGVGNRAGSALLQGADQARRSAGRILTVHAHSANKLVAALLDHRERCGGKLGLGIGGEAVNLFASLLATPAADALRDVDQDCFRGCHDSSPFSCIFRSSYDSKNSFTTFCFNSGVSRGSRPLIGVPPSCARAGDDSVNIALSRLTLFCIQGATIEPWIKFR